MRLDLYLFNNNFTKSRSRSQSLIKMGAVKLNGEIITKPAYEVPDSTTIEITQDNFASLGGFKLEKALSTFNFSPKDAVCLDVGASNGGFTEVLLKNGAKKIFALDVGGCALPDYLKNDSRVIVKDRINARYLKFEDIGESVDLVVIDVSFISLKLIIPGVITTLKSGGNIIALIKPQFEGEKNNLTKKGIVKDEKVIKKIIADISLFCEGINLKVLNITNAPLIFEDKNREYLILLQS